MAGTGTTQSFPLRIERPAETRAILASDANPQNKAEACQQLAVIAGPKSIPSLAALLGDEQPAACACYGLESIKDPAAGQALLNALPKLNGVLQAPFSHSSANAGVFALMKRYANVPMSFADACLVSMSEHREHSRILTLDSDSEVYRRHGRKKSPLLAQWSEA